MNIAVSKWINTVHITYTPLHPNKYFLQITVRNLSSVIENPLKFNMLGTREAYIQTSFSSVSQYHGHN